MINAKDLREKKIIVLGTGGSGKTVFSTRKLWKRFKCPYAYDINGDYRKLAGGMTYAPENIIEEFIHWIDTYHEMTKKRKIDALFIDDADSFLTYDLMNNPKFLDLVVRHRNKYHVTLVFIGKRPQNLPTKVMESAHVMFVYKIEGLNAVKRLQDIDSRMEGFLKQVYEKEYTYIEKWEGSPPVLRQPIKL